MAVAGEHGREQAASRVAQASFRRMKDAAAGAEPVPCDEGTDLSSSLGCSGLKSDLRRELQWFDEIAPLARQRCGMRNACVYGFRRWLRKESVPADVGRDARAVVRQSLLSLTTRNPAMRAAIEAAQADVSVFILLGNQALNNF